MSAAAKTSKANLTRRDAPLRARGHPRLRSAGDSRFVSPVRKQGNAVGSAAGQSRSGRAVGRKTQAELWDPVVLPGAAENRSPGLLLPGGRDRPGGRSRLRRVRAGNEEVDWSCSGTAAINSPSPPRREGAPQG